MKKLSAIKVDKKKRNKKNNKESGQAMVEFALLLPVLLLIICGILDFGWMFFNQLTLDNACREGARYAAVNSSEDKEELVEARIENACHGKFAEDVDIDIDYSKPNDRLTGDVTITLTTKMHVLTPVLGAFTDNMEKDLTSTVVMKVES